ncbi:MAG TPA: N-acetylmuramoyl-L-alanine amidase-like domain-containing protein [Myxococcales bacterium]|nr:N-acetylmuramoyl-L-alanine amidase-like domain-containing protein [Myxococcales bacterium]
MILSLTAVALLAVPRPPPLWKLPKGTATPPPETFAWLARFPRGRARALAASSLMLETPYQEGPLGEGTGPDPDPRIRFDAVDCQTFVEEALALGEAAAPDALLPILDDIRYGGAPTYEQRDHFMMSQWVPRNEAKGYLRDATVSIAGPVAQTERKRITAKSWAARRSAAAIQLPADRVPLGEWALPVVPLGQLLDVAAKIPDGALLLVVRADRWTYPERVTHLGFLVHHQGVPFLRHASTVFHRVVDEPLDHFVARNARYDWWPVVGMSVLSIRDAGARVARLVPSPTAAK